MTKNCGKFYQKWSGMNRGNTSRRVYELAKGMKRTESEKKNGLYTDTKIIIYYITSKSTHSNFSVRIRNLLLNVFRFRLTFTDGLSNRIEKILRFIDGLLGAWKNLSDFQRFLSHSPDMTYLRHFNSKSSKSSESFPSGPWGSIFSAVSLRAPRK